MNAAPTGAAVPSGAAPPSARRPTLLLALMGFAAFLAIFDHVLVISDIPLLRNPAAVVTALAFGLYLWYRREGVPLPQGTLRWIVAFLLYTALLETLRGVWTGEPQWMRYLQWAQILVLAIVTVDLARDTRAFGFVWGGIMAAVTFMAAATVVALPGFTTTLDARVGFEGVNLNTQGYWYAMAATTFVWWILHRWPRFGWVGAGALAGVGVVVLALLQTASRSALLGLVVGLATVLALSLRAKNLSAYATIVPVALLLLGFFVADAAVLQDRFERTLAGDDFGARDSIAEHALNLLLDEPLTGYGPSFLVTLGEARGMGRPISSHNSFLQVALTFGIPALLVWIGIMVNATWRAWRSYAANRGGVGALMVSLIVLSLVFGLVGDLGFNKYFWTMIALAAQAPLPLAVASATAAYGTPSGLRPIAMPVATVRKVTPTTDRGPG